MFFPGVRPIPISGLQGLRVCYKPLEKQVVLANPALKRIGLFLFLAI
jgi:hypothetical protein